MRTLDCELDTNIQSVGVSIDTIGGSIVNLKLFLEDFDPDGGSVSYVVEDENGDRVGRGEYTDESIKNYSPTTMDFFVLAFLPRLEELDAVLHIQGPMSESLDLVLSANISAGFLVRAEDRAYKSEDIDVFRKKFSNTHDLDETLTEVFNYYK